MVDLTWLNSYGAISHYNPIRLKRSEAENGLPDVEAGAETVSVL
jgi:hypothetical protein